jgi:hypothetical protein
VGEHPERLHQGQQRKRLVELVAVGPQHLAPGGGRLGDGGPQQGGLADARLALDQNGPAVAGGEVGDPAAQPLPLAHAANEAVAEQDSRHTSRLPVDTLNRNIQFMKNPSCWSPPHIL